MSVSPKAKQEISSIAAIEGELGCTGGLGFPVHELFVLWPVLATW